MFRHSTFNAMEDCLRASIQPSRPLRHEKGFLPVSQIPILASVSRLFSRGCPTKIEYPTVRETLRASTAPVAAKLIRVTVNAVGGARFKSHKVIERLETIAQPVAHRNTRPAIAIKRCVLRIETTGLDRLPRIVFRRLRHAVRFVGESCGTLMEGHGLLLLSKLVARLLGSRPSASFILPQPEATK